MVERKLVNGNGEAERFYRSLPVPSLIGLESCGNSQWFVELLEKLGHEVWIGDAAQIRASYVRKQKTDKRDAAHILNLLTRGTVSSAVGSGCGGAGSAAVADSPAQAGGDSGAGEKWVAASGDESRDAEESQAVEPEAGQKAFGELPLEGWAACRREDLQRLRAMLDVQIGKLDEAAQRAAADNEQARLLMTQPGVGPITALAFVLTLGRCCAVQAGQAGGQLSGADSARTQFGRQTASGRDQQAGQPLCAHVAGGSGADGHPVG